MRQVGAARDCIGPLALLAGGGRRRDRHVVDADADDGRGLMGWQATDHDGDVAAPSSLQVRPEPTLTGDGGHRRNLRRVPPQSLEAEESVLGGVLLDNTALDRVSSSLRPDDFYREAHRKIFRAMLELTERTSRSTWSRCPRR